MEVSLKVGLSKISNSSVNDSFLSSIKSSGQRTLDGDIGGYISAFNTALNTQGFLTEPQKVEARSHISLLESARSSGTNQDKQNALDGAERFASSVGIVVVNQ